MAKRARKAEPVSLLMVVRPNGFLAPATAFDEDRLARFPTGSTVSIAEPQQPKNKDKERLYRAVVGAIAKATGEDADTLHNRIKLATKRVLGVNVHEAPGYLHTSFLPISCADMDGPAFDAYFDDAVQHIQTVIVPGESVESILDMGRELLKTKVQPWQ